MSDTATAPQVLPDDQLVESGVTRFDESAARVLNLALRQALSQGCNHVNADHLRQILDRCDEAADGETEKGTLLDQFVELTTRKRDLEAEVNLLKKQIAPLEQQLLDEYSTEGVRSKKSAAGVTVWLNRRIWARASDAGKPAACKGLVAAGLGSYVEEGFNTSTLSAHFREIAKNAEAERGAPVIDLDELLPVELRGLIALTQDHKLGLTRS